MLFVRFRLSAVRYRLEADSKQPKTESGKPIANSPPLPLPRREFMRLSQKRTAESGKPIADS